MTSTINDYQYISDNYRSVREKVRKRLIELGRNPEEVKIVAVTKTHSVEVIDAALRFGIDIIGENRVQEAESKLPHLENGYREFHFIGHLQRNKINKLLKLKPTLIHSIDSLRTAEALNESLERIDAEQDVLVQVNTSGEESKTGIDDDIDTVRSFVVNLSRLNRLKVKGLMTISKLTDDEEEKRNCFIRLRQLFEQLKSEMMPNTDFQYLSMGMTDDYLLALEEGANILRIGTAIFGKRENQNETEGSV